MANLSTDKLNILLSGTGEQVYEVRGTNRHGRQTTIYETFPGMAGELQRRWRESESEFIRLEIAKFMRYEICQDCAGSRLKKEALSVTINDKTIVDIATLSIKDALAFVENLAKTLLGTEKAIAAGILKELKARLSFLVSVGLNYLTINRSANGLAGGEAQRIRLASQIGSGLSGVLYVLDEPSIGLHQRDNNKLINTLINLRDLGNSVIVVEHDREMMEKADYVFDFGPQAGASGGEIVAYGTVEQIKHNKNSLTGQYLSGKKAIDINKPAFGEFSGLLKLTGVSQHNLKNIDVSFPLGKFIVITGVSGSGKSTLVHDVLYHAIMSKLTPYHKEKPGAYRHLEGLEYINRVILIDQSPIGRTPRSNPATYTGSFTFIRDLFTKTKQARNRGYKAGRFSFNVLGGRCEACAGEGENKIEMQFLPDVYVTCEVCGGSRYNQETLEVNYQGKNIAEVLAMSVLEALAFFAGIPGLSDKLSTLAQVGLSYIKLGQSALTLSGGEAQRVKLATELSKRSRGKTLYLLDEPTTGLHFADLEKLLHVLRALVAFGNTVIVIEHNLDVIKNADYIIDLGPEGGDDGGYIVAEGTPSNVAKIKSSHTGQFLAKIL